MATKRRSRRRLKKSVVERFREDFPLAVFDYDRRLRPRLASALLRAGLTAIAAYGIGFGLGYFSWLRGMIDDGAFFKLVWILMIPATVAALLVWLILRNRYEYPLRREILERIRDREHGGTPLWCYAPVVQSLAPNDHATREVLRASRQERADGVGPEDYCQAVQAIDRLFADSGDRALGVDVLAEVEANLSRAAKDQPGSD